MHKKSFTCLALIHVQLMQMLHGSIAVEGYCAPAEKRYFQINDGQTEQERSQDNCSRKGAKMPETVQIRRSAFHLFGEDLSAWLYAAMRRFADYRLYRRSVSELYDLSVRELADLGLHRGEIRRVAYETVYGQRP